MNDKDLEDLLKKAGEKTVQEIPEERLKELRDKFEKDVKFTARTGITPGCFNRILILALLLVLVLVFLWLWSEGVFTPVMVLFL